MLQETFLALLKLEQQPTEPEHYCARTFRNRALNYRRTLWRRLTRELESQQWFEPSREENPAEAEAKRCLAGLPPEQREVIVLKIWNEFTFEAIGRLLELSPNTVAGRYRYGMNKLKTLLKGKEYEPIRSHGENVAVMDPAQPLG